ncbi:type VI secretion system membrane subunit TssM [Pseudoduganella lutea]|uniref:Type VI secretion system membrane subunit TssM n=1 Tax=Pseudoduganella lutea TaxID=321985 RepID=A0A4P6L5B9_9BURK|nr:type VI secretion system membrane subunit TssM [Pseudoduganella lutea]QBE66697.1 type VI secretion system membrane subunit TssM [Pseudoduganella lutea]
MKKLFRWLVKPPVLALLGVLLLALVIWFEAPLLSFDGSAPFASERVRWYWILALLLLWALWFGGKRLAVKLANLRLMESLAAQNKPAGAEGTKETPETQAELAELTTRMRESLAILRKSKTGGRGGLYQLPWYMIIGAPGTGKTTALTRSGLKFPLAGVMGKGAIGGIGGTRYCDWWFTDDAVLLDTAGRYTTQDSNAEADSAAWTGFLQLLRKHRRRRPINGVILALSVTDMLRRDEAGRAAHVAALRARLKELHEQLGLRFPVYVLVTKCDLLAGFVEFFDTLSREERGQAWGMTFPPEAGKPDVSVAAALAAFSGEFDLLEQRLQGRVLARMQQERDPERRALIYRFPQQFAGIRDELNAFLKDVFEPNRFEPGALLRGVYFSSGTQEGTPLDRVMSALAASFGVDRQVLAPHGAGGPEGLEGRSYFLTRVLRDVMFPEAEMAGVNHALERRRRWLQWGALGGAVLLFVLTAAGMVGSYLRNGAYVKEMAARTADLAKRVAAGGPFLPLLDAARALPGGYAEREQSPPWSMRFGLYQGDKLGEAARIAYRRLLQETLLPRVQQRMEERLRRGNAGDADTLYETLRVYLMLGDPARFDTESVAGWLAWDNPQAQAGLGEDGLRALVAHQEALLENLKEGQAMPRLDGDLVGETRLALAQMPLEQRVYASLKRQVMASGLQEFSAVSAGGPQAASVLARRSGEPLTRGINGMFTVAGHARFLEAGKEALSDVAAERWVLARQEAAGGDAAAMQQAVLRLYYDDYIAQWDALLADVAVRPFDTMEQGARVTNLLGGADSPLRKFLLAASRETTLGGAAKPDALPAAAAGVMRKLGTYTKRLQGALGTPAAPAGAPAMHPVDEHFDALHKLTAGTPPPLDATLALLKDVAVFLDAAASAKRTGAPPPPADALAKVRLEADGKPEPLAGMLKALDSSGAGLASGGERERLNALWRAGPATFCRQAVAGRYPIRRGAAADIPAEDFGKLFAPGGMIDDFFQKNLAQYVDMSGSQWRWRPTAGNAALGISQGTLDEFQRAARIRDAWFGGGGQLASMRFALRPVSLDPAITKLTLDIDGQPLAVAPGAMGTATFQVPSGKGTGVVQLDATPPAAQGALRKEGPWAWLRMLDAGTVETTAQSERYRVTFDVDGKKAVFEMTASSVVNPFRRGVLEQFRCMEGL